MKPPLLVHLLFHPRSDDARRLAHSLHLALNDDASLPGLRIPTVIAREDGSGLPPAKVELGAAERNVLVALSDDEMLLEPADLPPGRIGWPSFMGDAWALCNEANHRFLPIQLSEHAWPLEPRFSGTNALRAHLCEGDRDDWVARRLVIELCRYLLRLDRGAKAPVRLFLSHARGDIEAAPQVFKALVEHLTATEPVENWIDSAQIEGGSEFAREIDQGVRDSALLVVATRSYSSRPWCRKELLLAKRHGRPVVVIDALEGLDLRSFPYAGNAPELRWADGGAERAVNLILKETLRTLHMRLVLDATKAVGDVILTSPPELATVVSLAAGCPVLYPDPPLGDEEVTELAPLGHRLETPLQRAGATRALVRMPIAISTSESDDPERYGVFAEHRDAALIEVTRQLLVRGATLHYGGHLGSRGYTLALFDMARAYNAESGLPPAERIVNDVGWPLPLATLPKAERAKHQAVARYRRVPRPAGVEALEPETFVEEPVFFEADSPARRFAWARGMTEMRNDQTTRTRARIVLAGKVGPTVAAGAEGQKTERWYSGRIPGVVEEAYASVRAGQPLYLLGAFGGAAALIGDLLDGRARPDFSWEYHRQAPHSEGMRELYGQQGLAWEDYADIARALAELGFDGLSRRNGLSLAENRELMFSSDVGRIVELLVKGLTAVATSPKND